VHRLLQETPKTFYEHILECRLVESRMMDPSSGTLNMAEIARRAGFVDRSYFHRVFCIRFGETPADVRAAAAREIAGRFVQGSPKRSST
jgi:AraC-like DNA-binding protein